MSIHGDCLPTVANLKLWGLCCWKPKFLFWNKKIWSTGCLSKDFILILKLVDIPKISSQTKHFVKSLTPFFPNPCRLVPSLFPQRPPMTLGTTFFSARRPPRNFGSQPATGPVNPKMMLQLDRKKNLGICHDINVPGFGRALDPRNTMSFPIVKFLVLMICEFFLHVPRKLWGFWSLQGNLSVNVPVIHGAKKTGDFFDGSLINSNLESSWM